MIYIVIIFIALIAISGYFSAKAAKKRREDMSRLASELQLNFDPSKDHSYDERYPFIKKLCQGRNRYAFNILQGTYRSHPIYAFDYHYKTTSTDGKGKRKTHHHYFSFFILHFEGDFPELVIYREGLFSKLTQFLGFDDIDFESVEFSKRFVVKSSHKKFAYDICHSRMIEHLLRNEDLSIEIERDVLTLFFSRRLDPQQIQYNLDRLIEIRELFPQYLFDR